MSGMLTTTASQQNNNQNKRTKINNARVKKAVLLNTERGWDMQEKRKNLKNRTAHCAVLCLPAGTSSTRHLHT